MYIVQGNEVNWYDVQSPFLVVLMISDVMLPLNPEPSLVRGADCVVPADVGRNIKLELKLFSLLVFNNSTFSGCYNIFWSESGRLKCLPPVFWPVSGRLPPPVWSRKDGHLIALYYIEVCLNGNENCKISFWSEPFDNFCAKTNFIVGNKTLSKVIQTWSIQNLSSQ